MGHREHPISVTVAAKDRIDAIDQKHHIPVTVATRTITFGGGTPSTSYACAPVPEDKQVGQLAVLQRELSKMPAAALQRNNIKEIVLCGDLKMRTDMWIFPDITEPLSGLSNNYSRTIYLSRPLVFHHELFHVMWGKTGSCGGSILSNCQDSDEQWTALEPDKNHYDPNEERPNYAMYLFDLDTKDGQEQYDALMQEPGSRAKMTKVKKWLQVVDPRLDEKFWGDLRSGKVDSEYWSRQK